MADISQIIPLFGALKDTIAIFIKERDRQKLTAIQIDLTDKIIELQSKILEIDKAIILERAALDAALKRVSELESDEREKARYELAKIGTIGNFFAYRLRDRSELTERIDEPQHFICQPCFNAGKKAVLLIGEVIARCPLCKIEIPLIIPAPVPPRPRRYSLPNL